VCVLGDSDIDILADLRHDTVSIEVLLSHVSESVRIRACTLAEEYRHRSLRSQHKKKLFMEHLEYKPYWSKLKQQVCAGHNSARNYGLNLACKPRRHSDLVAHLSEHFK
jgi:hypothetical protein